MSQANCASGPDSVEARYVSPNNYQAWSCDQLADERLRLSKEVQRVSGLQRENANADAALMTVGIIIFWPALLGLAATKDRKEELGRLKGEYEAVDLSIRTRQCSVPPPGGTSMPAPPTPQTAAAVAAVEGTYKGKGKTDSWCQTPTMTVRIKGNMVEGELSEIAAGTTTSVITGTMDNNGVVTLDFRATRDAAFSGRVDGLMKNGILDVHFRSKAANSCGYYFELKRE